MSGQNNCQTLGCTSGRYNFHDLCKYCYDHQDRPRCKRIGCNRPCSKCTDLVRRQKGRDLNDCCSRTCQNKS